MKLNLKEQKNELNLEEKEKVEVILQMRKKLL
jgi:hypothetical protein